MKRSSPGSPLGGGNAKRFEKMRSSPQMHLQHQFHQQQLHQQQQLQQQYFPGIQTPPPNLGIMPPQYARVPPPPSSYLYNNNNLHGPPPPLPPMAPRVWNYNVPPPLPPHGPHLNNNQHQHHQQQQQQQAHINSPTLPFPLDTEYPSTSKQALMSLADVTGVDDEELQTIVNRKSKRKSMSTRYGTTRNWVREDALRVIALEEEYSRKHTKAPILLLRFPDPDLNRDIIAKYSPQIESVHFQQNSAPRYCFVHLKEGTDVDATIETISKIPFGTGYVSAELKRIPVADPSPSPRPDDVDPYTLYVGNLPTTISSASVKRHFPGAHRIDIGFAQRMKYTRYAFVRYDTVEEAMEAYRRSVNTLIETRSLIVRFRRERSTIPKEVNGSAAAASVSAELTDSRAKELDVDPASTDDKTVKKPESNASSQLASVTQPTPPPTLLGANNYSTTFDSPLSLDEPVINESVVDSKENVLTDAQKSLQQAKEKQPSTPGPQRRSSLEEMFSELERREESLADLSNSISNAVDGLPSSVRIKVEQNWPEDDLSEDEDPPANNLLGARYKESEAMDQIKTEPEEEQLPLIANKNQVGNHTPTRDEIYPDVFENDEDFESETEEEDESHRSGTTADLKQSTDVIQPIPKSESKTTINSWETLRQNELTAASEEKPDVTRLPAMHANNGDENGQSSQTNNEHREFMKTLYAQVRRAKETEEGTRPRDELHDMFAQMDSDADEEDDDLF